MVISLGSDRKEPGVPAATLSIVALSCCVQIFQACCGPSSAEVASTFREEKTLLRAVWNDFGDTYVKRFGPSNRKTISTPRDQAFLEVIRQKFVKDFKSGLIVDKTSTYFVWWRQIARKRGEARGLLSWEFRSLIGNNPSEPYTMIAHTFVHAGYWSFFGSMVLVFVFGVILEERWGWALWSMLYLLGALVTASLHGMINETSLVGSTGVISVAMGSFAVVHWKRRVVLRCTVGKHDSPPHGGGLSGFKGFRAHLTGYWAVAIGFLFIGVINWDPQWTVTRTVDARLLEVYVADVGGFAFGMIMAWGVKLFGADKRFALSAAERTMFYADDAGYRRALRMIEQGDSESGRRILESFLLEKPEHLGALVQLSRLCLADAPEGAKKAARTIASVISATQKIHDSETALYFYREFLAAYPDGVLDLHAMFAIAELLRTRGRNPRQALDAYEKLIQTYPDAQTVPKALLNSAELLLGPLEEPETGCAVLNHMIVRYEGTPFADRARALLDSQPAKAPSP